MILPANLMRSARRLRLVTLAFAGLVLAVMVFGVVATASGATDPARSLSFNFGVRSPEAHAVGLVVMLLIGAPFTFALWKLSCMLACVEQGRDFAGPTIGHLRAFAWWVFVTALASILLPIMANIGLGLVAGATAERLTITVDGGDTFTLLISGLLFFVARLLDEAQAIADENSQIV